MPITEDEMILSTTEYFVTENKLNPKATAAEVAAFVKEYSTTGLVTYTTNEGGIQGIIVVERKRLNDEESNEVRKVLGMSYEVECDGDEEEE